MNDHYSLEELKRVLHLTRDDRDVPPWIDEQSAKLDSLQAARDRYEAIEQREAQQPKRRAS